MKDVLLALKNLGTPQRAEQDQAYHKSSREHWGVPMPITTQFARTLAKDLSIQEILNLAEFLWETNLFDPMMCASKLLTLSKIKPTNTLWDLLLKFLKRVDGWALEDTLVHVAWKCILANESLLDTVETWTTDSNFWMRRAALVYTLPYAKPNRNPERMLSWASLYSADPEWFIQKAIGWWLRDLSEHNPERVLLFLELHSKQLKAVAKREATRKLSI